MDVTSTAKVALERSRRLPRYTQHAYAAILVFVAYYGGAKLGLALTLSPSPISVLWPPNATLLAALLLAPARLWPLLILAAFPAHLLAELPAGVPLLMVLCWFVSNVGEALIGAVCVRRLVGDRVKLESVREVGVFILYAAFLAAFLSSFLDAAFVKWVNWGSSTYAELWRTRFFSNVLATLTIVPMIVTLATSGIPALRNARASQVGEGLLLTVGLLAATIVAFDIEISTPGVPTALLYLPLAFLFWAALRFGTAGTSVAFAAVALLAIWGAAHGLGPFSSNEPAESAMAMQFFLTFIAITFLALAAFVHERKEVEARLRSSEERFATAFQSSPDAIAISRKSDGRFVEVNERWLSMFGQSRDAVVGRTLRDLNLVVDDTAPEKLAALADERGNVHQLELDLRAAKGEIIHARIATRAVEMERERRFITIIRDDTERWRAETALRESEARFRTLADTAPVMIWLTGPDKGGIFFNKGWLDFTGRSLEEELGFGWAHNIHPDDLERCVSIYQQAFDAKRSFAMEYRLRRADSAYRWVLDTGVPRVGLDGNLLGYTGSCVDITDRYELQRNRQELAHLTRISVMGELAASLAHELSQPLTAILSNVQGAQRLVASGTMDDRELRSVLADIAEAVGRAGEVIRRMRDLARKGELEVSQLDLSAVLREVGSLVQTDTIMRGVHLSIATNGALPVRGDKVQLQQVLLNLLINAFDAVRDQPSRDRVVAVHADRVDDSVRVRVSDRGPGLNGDELEKVFTPFFTSKRDGLGLGLSISRSIIEAHGGRLIAANNVDQGATFQFTLPADDQASAARSAA